MTTGGAAKAPPPRPHQPGGEVVPGIDHAQFMGDLGAGAGPFVQCTLCQARINKVDWPDHVRGRLHSNKAQCEALMRAGRDGCAFPPSDKVLMTNHVWCEYCTAQVSLSVWARHTCGTSHGQNRHRHTVARLQKLPVAGRTVTVLPRKQTASYKRPLATDAGAYPKPGMCPHGRSWTHCAECTATLAARAADASPSTPQTES